MKSAYDDKTTAVLAAVTEVEAEGKQITHPLHSIICRMSQRNCASDYNAPDGEELAFFSLILYTVSLERLRQV